MGKRLFLLILTAWLVAGCTTQEKNGGFDVKEPAKPQRTKYRTFISDEELKTQKELALIEANKSIALQKIDAQTRLKQLELQKEKELELLREKERLLAIEHRQAMERYALIGGILLLLLLGAALLWYFDKRRKDKLRAYEDNLKKYFHQKENEARVRIAEKILDTVASGELGMEQKTRLIEALHGPVAKGGGPVPEEEPPQIEERPDEDAIDVDPHSDEEEREENEKENDETREQR